MPRRSPGRDRDVASIESNLIANEALALTWLRDFRASESSTRLRASAQSELNVSVRILARCFTHRWNSATETTYAMAPSRPTARSRAQAASNAAWPVTSPPSHPDAYGRPQRPHGRAARGRERTCGVPLRVPRRRLPRGGRPIASKPSIGGGEWTVSLLQVRQGHTLLLRRIGDELGARRVGVDVGASPVRLESRAGTSAPAASTRTIWSTAISRCRRAVCSRG
jgi:hypothetical protein